MNTENLSTLKIHKLTQEQYNRELNAGRIDPSAMYLTPEDDSLFLVNIDVNNLTCSHSASEIIDAVNSGKTVINNHQLKMTGYSDSAPYKVYFSYTQLDSGGVLIEEHATVMDDKSVIIDTNPDIRAMVFIINSYSDNTASHSSDEIMNIFSRGSIVKLALNTRFFCDLHSYDNDFVYFIGEQFYGAGKLTVVFSIDKDKNISTVYEDYQANIPLPYSSDAGKVLVAGDNQVSWESTETFVDKEYFDEMIGDEPVADQINNALENFSSGKTLTEHLTEEDMILSSRQYGDKLPGEDGESYTHVPGRIFFLRVSE